MQTHWKNAGIYSGKFTVILKNAKHISKGQKKTNKKSKIVLQNESS